MNYLVAAVLVLSLAFPFSGCKKEGITNLDCAGFRQGIVSNDVEKVRKSIRVLLGAYSQENINKLAEAISGNCTVTATVACFECIKTLPPQTEITVSFIHNGATVRKLLDISYTQDNRMKIVNMHE